MRKNTPLNAELADWFSTNKNELVPFFARLESRVFKVTELEAIFKEKQTDWKIERHYRHRDLIKHLLRSSPLRRIDLAFPGRKEIRYCWGEASPLEIALSINPNCYLSHFSASEFHGLTDQIPKIVYVNIEQPPPPHRDRNLTQGAVDAAFALKVRVSRRVAEFDGIHICILNCMGAGGKGVVNANSTDGKLLRVATVERTLIDIAVRPIYAGGVYAVLDAFRRAHGNFSVASLSTLLQAMDHIYPFHQVLGFYLEKAGNYAASELKVFEAMPQTVDFYLTHAMGKTSYSERWRLYYPSGL